MLKLVQAVALLLMWTATPAFADKFLAVTPSGAAETIFPDKPAVTVGKLSSRCIDARWTVISSSPNEVVCEAPLNMGQSILGQVLMGNSYSTPPRRYFRFNLADLNGVSRVQASGWMELQMAFGQIKRTDFAGPEFQNNIMRFMLAAGGKYPVGTTFPNHAVMGINIADAPDGRYVGLRVTAIVPGGVAEKAGMQVGDVVTHIAHKQFKNLDGYLDATAKAAETPSYDVELLRNGVPMTFRVDRAFRPAITEQVVGSEAAAESAEQVSMPSVADELEKLAKLKAQGVLTAEEFEAQKKKLLSR